MNGVPITLTWPELAMAAQVGARRHMEALKRGLPDRHGFDGEGWNVHVEGAAGEMAFAKALGLYWDGSVNTFKRGGDVGDFQVRTRSRDDYDLIVRANDRDADVFWLVTGKAPGFTVRGWVTGADAKRDEFARNYGGRPSAFFVPQSRLNHPSEYVDARALPSRTRGRDADTAPGPIGRPRYGEPSLPRVPVLP